jgi:cytochrome c nitrite reductase small subunit
LAPPAKKADVLGTAGARSVRRGVLRSIYPRSPETALPLLFAVALGVAVGVGIYTFNYAKGLSYFGTEPSACVNCHIMEPQYAGWQKSSHHGVARCIECHLPHSFIPKYLAKAENGYRHGKLFTTQSFEEPITVKPAGLAILQENCERCHADLVHDLLGVGDYGLSRDDDSERQSGEVARTTTRSAGIRHEVAEGVQCVHCHSNVGHGERAGLGPPARGDERPPLENGARSQDHD